MLDDAMGTLYFASNEIDGALEHTKADFGYCLQKQSERFMAMMDAKAAAAEEQTRQLRAQHRQELEAVRPLSW